MLSHSASRCRQTPQMDTGQPAEDLAEPVAIGRAAREVRGDDEEGGTHRRGVVPEVWLSSSLWRVLTRRTPSCA